MTTLVNMTVERSEAERDWHAIPVVRHETIKQLMRFLGADQRTPPAKRSAASLRHRDPYEFD